MLVSHNNNVTHRYQNTQQTFSRTFRQPSLHHQEMIDDVFNFDYFKNFERNKYFILLSTGLPTPTLRSPLILLDGQHPAEGARRLLRPGLQHVQLLRRRGHLQQETVRKHGAERQEHRLHDATLQLCPPLHARLREEWEYLSFLLSRKVSLNVLFIFQYMWLTK